MLPELAAPSFHSTRKPGDNAAPPRPAQRCASGLPAGLACDRDEEGRAGAARDPLSLSTRGDLGRILGGRFGFLAGVATP